LLFVALGASTLPALARAAPPPPQYRSTVRVDGARVEICYALTDWAGKPVDLSSLPEHTLFREARDHGTTVALPERRLDPASYSCCFVDECVPAGAYRYGLGCNRPADEVTVASVAGPCERSAGASAPTEVTQKVNFGKCPRRSAFPHLKVEYAIVIGVGILATLVFGAWWLRRGARKTDAA